MPHDLTKDELDSLSPNERAAVLAGDDDPPPVVDDGEPDAHHSIGTGGAPADPPPTPAAPAAPAAATPPVETPDDGEQEPFAVPYRYDPGQFDLKAAEEAIAELDKKFQEGDIDLNEYNRERDAIREEITTHKVSAKISTEMGGQVAMAKWEATVESFLAQDKNLIYKDEIKYAALNETVKKLARDKANSNKSEAWLLKEADRLVRASFGVASAPTPPKDPKQAAMVARQPPPVPPTLGDLPAAAPSGDEDEFASLDNLNDGTPEGQMRLEAALARMSPEQAKRYLES